MTSQIETIEADMIALIEAAAPYLRAVRTVTDEQDFNRLSCNPPVVFIQFDSRTQDGGEQTPLCVGAPRVQSTVIEFDVFTVTRQLKTAGGRTGAEGAYQVLEDVRGALLGKVPAGATQPLSFVESKLLSSECPRVIYRQTWRTITQIQEV